MYIRIGKQSNDQIFQTDLRALPHLFICYSDPAQFSDFVTNNFLAAGENSRTAIAAAVTASCYDTMQSWLPPSGPVAAYIRQQGEANTGSRYDFLKGIRKELNRRRKAGIAAAFQPMVLIIEDVFELVISPKKFTGLYFLELLREGPVYHMHVIAGSIRTYRNLLQQLNQQQTKQYAAPETVAAELIINPEDLFFFRERTATDYSRYFHRLEGVCG